MSVAAEQLAAPHTSMGAGELDVLSHTIGETVLNAKRYWHPPRGESHDKPEERRRMSAREIAEQIGVGHPVVVRAATALWGEDESKSAVGRGGYRYTLAEAVQLRQAIATAPEHRKKDLDRRRQPGEPCVVVGVVNFKGGVAKSTTTSHAGFFHALHGHRVLCIDMDPQATLSTLFGIHPDLELGDEDTLLPYYEGSKEDLRYCIRKTEIPTLDVIPANVGLSNVDMILPHRQQEAQSKGSDWLFPTVLAEGLKTIQDDYDVIFIDCPPQMSYLTMTAAMACDALIIPMRPSMPDFASSAQFVRVFNSFLQFINEILPEKRFDWVQVLITLWEKNSANIQMEEVIRGAYGDMVLPETFPHLSAVATAAKCMRTLYDVSRQDVDGRSLTRSMGLVDALCASIEKRVLATRARKRTHGLEGAV